MQGKSHVENPHKKVFVLSWFVLLLMGYAVGQANSTETSEFRRIDCPPTALETFRVCRETALARRSAWLKKAEACKPKLFRREVTPVRLVKVVPDKTAFQGWRTVPNGEVDSALRRVLKRGERPTGLARSGFGLAAETLHFKKAIDRGWPDYDDPVPTNQLPLDHMKQVYAFLAKRDGLTVEKFRLGATDQIVPLRAPASVEGFSVRNIAANGRLAFPDGTIKNVMVHSDGSPVKSYNENLMSLGTVFSYGKFRFLTAGDFSGPGDLSSPDRFYPERELGKASGKVDVAKINHHGHHSMPPELVRDLQARVYAACVWDQLHVTDDTMTHLSDTSLYPGERTIFPGIMTAERRAAEGDRPWMRNVPEAVYDGAHIVLTVPPGGETYRITCLTAADESMRIKATFDYQSHGTH